MYDVASEHVAGLVALLLLPPIWLAVRWLPRYQAASLMTRWAAWLMLATGLLHLALIPSHLPDEPLTALLFLINGFGFVLLSVAAFVTRRWRPVAAFWLSATILAYLLWVVAGWETPDQVGIACKLIEILALGLVMRLKVHHRDSWWRRARRAAALPLMTSLTTLAIFFGGLAHPDALHAHAGAVLQPVNAVATPDQVLAAQALLAQTRAAIAPFRDPAMAIAAGYQPAPASDADRLEHWSNKANAGVILDPGRPQDLVYLQTPQGLLLMGAMFQMPRIGQWGPDPGGPLMQWHQHEGICFSPAGSEFAFATPFWTCPLGSISVTPPPMLHVWIVENPLGPFAADLDPRVIRVLQNPSASSDGVRRES
jgi:hypothetical protein